jgi:hypothetical protein
LGGCRFEVRHERDVGKHGDLDELDGETSAFARCRRGERRDVHGDGDDAPHRARTRLTAIGIERIELYHFAACRKDSAQAFGEHLLMATVTNDSQSDHSGAWEPGGVEWRCRGRLRGVSVDQPNLSVGGTRNQRRRETTRQPQRIRYHRCARHMEVNVFHLLASVATVAIAGGSALFGYWQARQFTQNKLRYVDGVHKAIVPVLAGAAAVALATPIVWLLPLVGGGTALLFGGGVAMGVSAGARDIRKRLPGGSY